MFVYLIAVALERATFIFTGGVLVAIVKTQCALVNVRTRFVTPVSIRILWINRQTL